MSKWTHFNAASRRLFADFDHETVHVYNYTEQYDPDTGGSEWTQVEDANSPVEANITEPSRPDVSQTATGDDVEADVRIYLADDTGVQLVPVGEDDSHPTVIETAAGTRYTVHDVTPEQNGLITLTGVEA